MNNIRKYYDKKISFYGTNPKREEKIMQLLDKKLGIVLDVGCGQGDLGKKLLKKSNQVIGIDISPLAIKKAKKILTDAKIVDLNNQKIPVKQKSFNLIIASEVIEHLFTPINALQEFHRVLKTDGELIITTPNLLYWGHRLKFLKGQFGYEKFGVFDESHVHFYSYQSLQDDLKKTGFKIVAENHIYQGNSFLNLRKKYPGLFAYQFILKCQKKIVARFF